MTGFSPRNLSYMRAFAKAYPDLPFVQQAAALLTWGHHLKLLDGVRNDQDRRFDIEQAAKHGGAATSSSTRSPATSSTARARR
jgi:hypothetical protein